MRHPHGYQERDAKGSPPCLTPRGGYKALMQEVFLWRQALFIGVGLAFFTTTGWSQQAAPGQEPNPGSDASSYVKFGMSNGQRGDLDAAVAAFNEAITIDPKFAPAYYNRGLAHALQNRFGDAIRDYNQAIQINPNYAAAYYQRGSLLGQQADFDGAIADFSRVIKLVPSYGPAYYNRGHVEYFRGDLDDSLSEINHALGLTANFPFAYFIRGLIERAKGERPEAVSDFQKSAGLGFSEAALWVWIVERENGQRGIAREDLSNALTKANSFRAGEWPTPVAEYLLDKITDAQLLTQANQGAANDIQNKLCEAWFYIGMVKHLAGDRAGAQDAFSRSIATGAKGSEEFIESTREMTPTPTE
jgi:tetratricopeptide (TPR) repeat protein